MTEDLITTGTVVAAVAGGLVAGVMLAFSTSVMPALRRRPAAELWRRYVRRWTAWNNVRTLAGTAASALLIVSLL